MSDLLHTPAPAAALLLLLLLGPAIGSWLAVLVDRLPRGEDTRTAPSACRACGRRLRWAQMIPLVSFIAARGRCKHCGSAIPPWLFHAELLAAGAGVLAVIRGGSLAEVALAAAFLWLLIALALADLLWMRLFDGLTAALALVAFAMALLPGWQGAVAALWGALAGAGSFAALRWSYRRLRGREGLGLGDVKLMVGLGAFAGPRDLPLLVLLAALSALAIAALHHLRGGQTLHGGHALPFGAALCLAAALLWVLGPPPLLLP